MVKQYRIHHSKQGYMVVDDLTDKEIAVFKKLRTAKTFVKKRTVGGMKLARKMKKAGYDDAEIVQETGYHI